MELLRKYFRHRVFFTAYLVEYSLSADNLFIFVIIFAQFAVPNAYHPRVLLIRAKLIVIFLHEEFSEIPKIPTVMSLGVIALILAVSTAASLIKSSSDPAAKAHAGRITAQKTDKSE